MRTTRSVVAAAATLALAFALGVDLPASAQAASPVGLPSESSEATASQPEGGGSGTPAKDEAAGSGGTAQGLEVASGFGRLLGSVRVQGDVEVGYRFVGVGGSEVKYREQYDFNDGLRVLASRVVVSPDRRDPGRAFDRITLSANGLGGDPYETWSLGAYRTGTYRADVRYRSVDYFYADPGDIHAWDQQRKYLDINLSTNIASNFVVLANFNNFRSSGDRDTTRDFDRDEFHFHEPIDQEGTDYGFGFRWNLGRTDVFFTQQFVNFRDNSGFVSGPNAGGPTATFIESLSNTEVRAMDAPISTGGFRSVLLNNRLELYGDLLYSEQQTSSAFAQSIEGLDRSSRPANTTWTNQGLAQREVLHGNFEARVRAHRQVIVTAKYRHRDWDQDGDSFGEDITVLTATNSGSVSNGIGLSSYRVKGDQILFGAEVMPTESMNIFGEVGYSTTDKSFAKETIDSFTHGSDEETDVTTTAVPFRIGGFFRPDQRVDVKLTYSRADVDDPLTQVFPTVADGLKLRSRFRPADGWTVAADLTYRRADNTISDYEFDGKTFAASLGHAISDRGSASVGYTYLDTSSAVPFVFVLDDRTVGQSVSAYEARTNVFTLAGRWTVSEATPAEVYGSIGWVDNDGTIPLSRWDLAFGGRYTLANGIFIDANLRFIDYAQALFHEQGIILTAPEPSSVNDFDATLFTISMGFRFF